MTPPSATWSTVHYSQVAVDRINTAQHAIAVHGPSLTAERCPACGNKAPCAFRIAAEGTLRAYNQLPRRHPGATLPIRS